MPSEPYPGGAGGCGCLFAVALGIFGFVAYLGDLPPVEKKEPREPTVLSSGIFERSDTRESKWGVPGGTIIYWTNGSTVELDGAVPHQMVVGKKYRILMSGWRCTIEEVPAQFWPMDHRGGS